MGIKENLEQIHSEIHEAATQSGRDPGEIKLIAVSKTKPVGSIREAMAAGQRVFGENRVQELVSKHEAIDGVEWHLIGSLQRNKVKYIISFVDLIHSVDSEKLLNEINRQAEKAGRIVHCLLQVNISDEEQKSGMDEHECEEILAQIENYPFVRIEGLMGMAEFTDDLDVVRSQFRRLKLAKARLSRFNGPQVEVHELSMGMSGDFQVAIEEGSTMVRVGSSIFGTR